MDGRCALAGFDPLDLRADRFVNLIYAMIHDSFWDDEERSAFVDSMRAPETVADSVAAQDRSAREWAAQIGLALPPGV